MLNVALWEPEIPPNTGNIARTCAATGIPLHLIGRLGFQLDDRSLRRAGCDYWEAVDVTLHEDFEAFQKKRQSGTLYCFSAHATRRYTDVEYRPGDWLLFGSESRGLPPSILELDPNLVLTVPMLTNHVRSLNLATVAGIVIYEALRQVQQW